MTSTTALRRTVLAAAFVCAFVPVFLTAQAPKPIALEDYARFKRIGGAALSSDGKWMAYTVTPNDGDGVLFVQSLDTAAKRVIARGTGAVFSPNARHVAYFVAPESSRGRGAGGRGGGAQTPQTPATGANAAAAAPAARAFELLDLSSDTKTVLPSVASFSYSPDGDWILIRPQAAGTTPAPAAEGGGRGGRGGADATPAAATGPAGDLLLRNLTTGQQRYVANVDQFAFDDSDAHMAYTVRGQGRLGNGVYTMTMKTGEQTMLDGAVADYAQLTWSRKGTNLLALRGDKARDKAQKDNVLLAWTNVATPASMKSITIDPAKVASFPAGMVISEYTAPRWGTDGARILVGLKAQETEAPASTEPKANVDVWHWKDADPQSVQIIRVNQDRRATFAAVVDLAPVAVRQIANDDMRAVTATDDLRWGIGRVDTPYRGQIQWGGSKADTYRVNLATGQRDLIEPGLSRTMGLSPDGKWFLYLQKGHVHSYDMASGKKTAIDGGKSFVNAEDDHDYEKPVYGVAGFSSDGKSVLLYDRYDVWAAPLAGGQPVNLTKGVGAKAGNPLPHREARTRRSQPEQRGHAGDRSRPNRSGCPPTASGPKSPATTRSRPAGAGAAHLDGQGDRHAHRRVESAADDLHAADVHRISELLGRRHALQRCAADHGRRSVTAQGLCVGLQEAHRLHEQQRPAAAGHAHAAGRLRARQAVSDARVLLRADVEHASQLLRFRRTTIARTCPRTRATAIWCCSPTWSTRSESRARRRSTASAAR